MQLTRSDKERLINRQLRRQAFAIYIALLLPSSSDWDSDDAAIMMRTTMMMILMLCCHLHLHTITYAFCVCKKIDQVQLRSLTETKQHGDDDDDRV